MHLAKSLAFFNQVDLLYSFQTKNILKKICLSITVAQNLWRWTLRPNTKHILWAPIHSNNVSVLTWNRWSTSRYFFKKAFEVLTYYLIFIYYKNPSKHEETAASTERYRPGTQHKKYNTFNAHTVKSCLHVSDLHRFLLVFSYFSFDQ